MVNPIRIVVGLLGVLLMVGGLVGVAAGAWPQGLWSTFAGAVVVVAVVFERSRYRSEATERGAGDPGPGGGERSMPVAPFRPTGELFVDPTSGRRLRVYLNPATGERRYYAEEERAGG